MIHCAEAGDRRADRLNQRKHSLSVASTPFEGEKVSLVFRPLLIKSLFYICRVLAKPLVFTQHLQVRTLTFED